MHNSRRIRTRPYFFEWFTVANFVLIAYVARSVWPSFIGTLPDTMRVFCLTLALQAAAGVVARIAIGFVRRDGGSYLRMIRRPDWIVDRLRMIFFGSLMIHVYLWIKLVVPLAHPRLFDQELWNLDRLLFFGLSPNVLFLDLFSAHAPLMFFDWAYGVIFFTSMTVAFAFFLSAPSGRISIAFLTGNSVMWIIGSWMYMLVPSLGPAYAFPDLWSPHYDVLHTTQFFQAKLLENYKNVLKIRTTGAAVDVRFGIGAMPSLHVGFQAFVFFWMRKLWRGGELLFALFVVVIFLGSMITGWHYMIDGIAGFLLALATFLAAARAFRVHRWLRLRAALTSRG